VWGNIFVGISDAGVSKLSDIIGLLSRGRLAWPTPGGSCLFRVRMATKLVLSFLLIILLTSGVFGIVGVRGWRDSQGWGSRAACDRGALFARFPRPASVPCIATGSAFALPFSRADLNPTKGLRGWPYSLFLCALSPDMRAQIEIYDVRGYIFQELAKA